MNEHEASAPVRRSARHFTEKTFYLEEFYGKSLLFALVPPSGERVSELDSLLRTIRELRRNQTRCIVIASPGAMPKLLRRLGGLAPRGEPPNFNPAAGLRTRPYPPDSAVAEIWRRLRAGSIVAATAETGDPADLIVFAQELASRLRVFKLLILERGGGIAGPDGARYSFVERRRIRRALAAEKSPLRRAAVRAASRALLDGVASVNLTAPRDVYDELFSFSGAGTLFTERQYANVRQISIDDFEEVQALIERGQNEGFLLTRNVDEIACLLPSCFGYRVGDEHLAGIVSLLTEPYRRESAGEITALYTLTRFQGEGVAAELMKEVLKEARERRLRYVFACTSEDRAARFFARLKFPQFGRQRFRRVGPADIAPAKWRGYDRARIERLSIFRCDLK
ncbi:MAG TPA: GNAT family N-acetyltransferase [Candidatus Binataceae bacterium]|nr:GNAT family N-acetyltransferase [Candidatus Binataceae bacterium]